jgi:hypothetical protein
MTTNDDERFKNDCQTAVELLSKKSETAANG